MMAFILRVMGRSTLLFVFSVMETVDKLSYERVYFLMFSKKLQRLQFFCYRIFYSEAPGIWLPP
jgi:hypothetical protein